MKRNRRKKGQSLVELALVFPFFLLIVVGGIIDFGFAFYNFLTLQQITNDVAEWAAEKLDTENETAVIEKAIALRPSWWSDAYTVQTPEWHDLDTGGRYVKVLITYNSPTYTPFYQTMLQATSGDPTLKLAAMASYKVPEFVTTR